MHARKQALYDKAQDAIDTGRKKGGRTGPGPWAVKYGTLAIQCLSERDSPVSTAEAEGYVGLALAYAAQCKPENRKKSIKELLGCICVGPRGEQPHGIRLTLRQELDQVTAEAQSLLNEDQAEREAIEGDESYDPNAWTESQRPEEESA